MGGAESGEIVELDLSSLPDVRAAYASIGVIVDKDLAYERASARSDGASQRGVGDGSAGGRAHRGVRGRGAAGDAAGRRHLTRPWR